MGPRRRGQALKYQEKSFSVPVDAKTGVFPCAHKRRRIEHPKDSDVAFQTVCEVCKVVTHTEYKSPLPVRV